MWLEPLSGHPSYCVALGSSWGRYLLHGTIQHIAIRATCIFWGMCLRRGLLLLVFHLSLCALTTAATSKDRSWLRVGQGFLCNMRRGFPSRSRRALYTHANMALESGGISDDLGPLHQIWQCMRRGHGRLTVGSP